MIYGIAQSNSNSSNWPKNPVWGGLLGAASSGTLVVIPAWIGTAALDIGDTSTANWSFAIAGLIVILIEEEKVKLIQELMNQLPFIENIETYELLATEILNSSNYRRFEIKNRKLIEVFLSRKHIKDTLVFEDLNDFERGMVYDLLAS
jgi:hypothetical protein